MRVITGTARGRKLLSPEGIDVRPTSDMVKEAIFSILQNDTPGAKVLDLFAGSGQLGIEALSRGASMAFFVDSAKSSLEVVRKNLDLTGFEEQSQVSMMEAKSFLMTNKAVFDIAFIDPPYHHGLATDILPFVAPHMDDLGIMVCETDLKDDLPEAVGEFTRKKEYRYGKIKVTTYRKED